MVYDNNHGGNYGKYFVQQLQVPDGAVPEDFKPIYETFARRILWMDGDVCPGAFQMNTAWYHSIPERDPLFGEHTHSDTDELIGFFGSDPEHPYELNAVLEFTLAGETHRLSKSTMIFVPAGLSHNPLRILEVKKPIFHFSVVKTAKYDGRETYK